MGLPILSLWDELLVWGGEFLLVGVHHKREDNLCVREVNYIAKGSLSIFLWVVDF
jgi:hypothetical protein